MGGHPRCSPANFPRNLSGIECLNLRATPSREASAALCAQACCDEARCSLWQYDVKAQAGTRCWTADVEVASGAMASVHGARGLQRDLLWHRDFRNTRPVCLRTVWLVAYESQAGVLCNASRPIAYARGARAAEPTACEKTFYSTRGTGSLAVVACQR